MTALRLTPTTSRQYDSVKGVMARISSALGFGTTTVKALDKAEADIVSAIADLKALRLMVRQEIAAAKQRERDDRKTLSKAQVALQREYVKAGYPVDGGM